MYICVVYLPTFRKIQCFYLQGDAINGSSQPFFFVCFTLKMKIFRFGLFTVNMNSLLSDETSTTNHSMTQRHIPEHYPTSSATPTCTSVKIKKTYLQFFLWSVVNVLLLLQSRGTFPCTCARSRQIGVVCDAAIQLPCQYSQ